MSITQTGLNKKIRINGIKLSTKLVQINLLNGSLPENTRPLFFQLLSQNQINIPFILLTCMGEKIPHAGDIRPDIGVPALWL